MDRPLFTWIDGDPDAALPLSDRGLHYGHGVFETLRVHDGDVPLWPYHRARLARGLERLGLSLDLDRVERDLRAALDAVLSGIPVSEHQVPSIGCSIKWKPGNEPA